MAVAEVEEETEPAHEEYDEGAGGATRVWEGSGGDFNLLGGWGSEGDLDGGAVDVVEAEVEGIFVGDADGSGGDGVFDFDREGGHEGGVGGNGLRRPREYAVGEGGPGEVGNVGVFEHIGNVFHDGVVASAAADIFGAEVVFDEVTGTCGLGDGVDVLGEVEGRFGLGEARRNGSGSNGGAAGAGDGSGGAQRAFDAHGGDETAGCGVGMTSGGSGARGGGAIVAEIEAVGGHGLAGSGAGAGVIYLQRHIARSGAGGEFDTG